MRCDASGSGSVGFELMWWLEQAMTHHLDRTLTGRLHGKGQSVKSLKGMKE